MWMSQVGDKLLSAKFLPFGDYREQPTTNPSASDRGFTGHKHNDSIGLIYMNARWMDPQAGRFVSVDPFVPNASNPQAYNGYSYVENNPIALTDPTGALPFRGVGGGLYEHGAAGRQRQLSQLLRVERSRL